MGLKNWFEGRVDNRALKLAEEILDDLVKQSASDPQFLRRYGELVATAMDGLWPCTRPDIGEYVVGVRLGLCRMRADEIFQTAYKLQQLAISLRKNGLEEAAIGTAFLSQWVNVLSIAEKRRGSQAMVALHLVHRYEDAIQVMLSECRATLGAEDQPLTQG